MNQRYCVQAILENLIFEIVLFLNVTFCSLNIDYQCFILILITMAKKQNDSLIQIIKSMIASEKRSFKLFSQRSSAKSDMLYLQLFDVLDKSKSYDEALILKKIPSLRKAQLSNVKANLFKQILTSLRLVYRKILPDISIREQFDFARVLYSKGLYKSSLDALDKAKKAAKETTWDTLQLEIIDFEKLVESQHVTGSMSTKAELLTQESNQLVEKIKVKRELSNLTLLLYGLFLERGLKIFLILLGMRLNGLTFLTLILNCSNGTKSYISKDCIIS